MDARYTFTASHNSWLRISLWRKASRKTLTACGWVWPHEWPFVCEGFRPGDPITTRAGPHSVGFDTLTPSPKQNVQYMYDGVRSIQLILCFKVNKMKIFQIWQACRLANRVLMLSLKLKAEKLNHDWEKSPKINPQVFRVVDLETCKQNLKLCQSF